MLLYLLQCCDAAEAELRVMLCIRFVRNVCMCLLFCAEQDLDWESTTPGPLRVAPMQRWISGELGL
jgi:hypothetical protein